ncbi:MAG: alkane 1-monooxygenase [Roseobacter sp.]|jgi:alkane 1-monooxygenase|nr:alkane 1-monooxygenase [Roseobacter sp.]
MRQQSAIPLFACASLLPATCLLAGALLAGLWPVLAMLSMTALVVAMDRVGPGFEAHASMTRWLPWVVGVAHFAVLGTTLWAIGQNGVLQTSDKLLLAVSLGLFAGQVSNACAHELIHRSDRRARWLGTAIYCSILNGQHVSAHLLVHHVHAGTAKDPCSAPVGRGFYRFAVTAAQAEFAEGWRAETQRRLRHARGLHPYTIYLGGAGLALAFAALLAGPLGVVALMAISLHAQMQLLLSDYVQHYGLRRRLDPAGKPEPMGPQHSWNAPQPYSAALMMNAPRHSDHHMQPSRPFTDLRVSGTNMPLLPRSMPVMGAIALVPALWRKIMDPRVAAWVSATQPPAPPVVSQPLMSR